jgi:putative inorganic carbon (HCO3(-)) transporter
LSTKGVVIVVQSVDEFHMLRCSRLTAAARFSAVIASAELPVVLAIAPALIFPTPKRLVVLLAVPIVWGCARAATGRLVPRTPLNSALWLLLVMVGVSVYVTPDVQASLGKVSGVLLGVLLFWATARWLQTVPRLKLAIVMFLGAALVLAAVGILGTPAPKKYAIFSAAVSHLSVIGVRSRPEDLVINGVPGALQGFNPNPLSGCLILFIPLQVLLLARGGHRWLATSSVARVVLVLFQVACLIVTAGTVLLMQSRGAWAAFAVATLAVPLWATRSRRLSGAVAVIGLGLALAFGPRVWQLVQRPSAPPAIGSAVLMRLELWSKALMCIRDFPLTGMGMNIFRTRMPELYPVFVNPHDQDVAHAHNNLLQEALDVGIPGLVAYVGIWIGVVTVLVRVYRHGAEAIHRTIALGLLTGLSAHFAFGMIDAIPLGSKAGVVFWLALALAIGLGQVASVTPAEWRR